MDVEKVKEIVFDALDELSANQGWTDYYKSGIRVRLINAEAAEQEEWKDLPMCNEERGKLVADRIDPCPWYNYWLCAYHRCQEGDIISHRCALPIDEPAADSEPERGQVTPKGRLENLAALMEETAEETLEAHHERRKIRERLDTLENRTKGHQYDHPTSLSVAVNKQRLDELKKRLEANEKELESRFGAVHNRVFKVEQRLDKLDIRLDGFIEEMDERIKGVYEHITATRHDLEEKLEEAEK